MDLRAPVPLATLRGGVGVAPLGGVGVGVGGGRLPRSSSLALYGVGRGQSLKRLERWQVDEIAPCPSAHAHKMR